MRRRGATLVELTFTLTLVVTTIGAVVGLYGYFALRSGDAFTQYNVYQQSNDLLKAMSETASNSISCQNVAIGSITAIKCTMPSAGTDTDNDGIVDKVQPSGVYKTLREYYSPGKRIWYFPSTKPVAIGTSGSFWYRAILADDVNPTTASIDSKWSYVTGATPRIYLPGTVSITQDASNLNTLFQLTINRDTNPNSSVNGFSGNAGLKLPPVTLTRRCYWKYGK